MRVWVKGLLPRSQPLAWPLSWLAGGTSLNLRCQVTPPSGGTLLRFHLLEAGPKQLTKLVATYKYGSVFPSSRFGELPLASTCMHAEWDG